MSLRKLYYFFPPAVRLWMRKLYYLPTDLMDTAAGKRHKYEPPKGDIYIGSGDFIQQGVHQVHLLKKYAKLQPTDAVLDIGSGIGRTAIPLTEYLSEQGSYEGFDVVKKGVDWCNRKIKKDFPNFNFTYVPLKNDLYNTRTEVANAFVFPYSDNQFDKALLFSVFTHMQIDEIQQYLKEIQRVLKPGGQCLATFFLYNDQIEEEIATRSDFSFPVAKNGHRLMSAEVTAANVAIEESKLDVMLTDANLQKVKYIPGYWKDIELKNEDVDFQDILVLAAPR